MASSNEDEFVISVNKENKTGYYRIHTLWKADKLCVNVASHNGAWVGEVPLSGLTDNSSMLKMPHEKFLEETKAALTTNEGVPGFVYAVEDNNFTWKKVIDEDTGMKVKLGSVPLQPASFPEVVQNMMAVALSTNQKLNQTITKLTGDKAFAESNIDGLLKKVELAAKTKVEMETVMMSQFVAILNAKKSKISELEEELLKLKAEISSSPRKKPRGRKQKAEVKDDPYGADTDEDMPLAVPSTSRSDPMPFTRRKATQAEAVGNSSLATVTSSKLDPPESAPPEFGDGDRQRTPTCEEILPALGNSDRPRTPTNQMEITAEKETKKEPMDVLINHSRLMEVSVSSSRSAIENSRSCELFASSSNVACKGTEERTDSDVDVVSSKNLRDSGVDDVPNSSPHFSLPEPGGILNHFFGV